MGQIKILRVKGMKKRTKNWTLAIIVPLFALLTFLYVDESLSPLSKELLEYKIVERLDNNGQVYLWCFACKTDDVYESAKNIQQKINQTDKSNYEEDIDWDEFDKYKFADNLLICNKFETDCNVFEIANNLTNDKLKLNYFWALARYQSYFEFDFYMSQTYPSEEEPLPNHRALINSQKTYHIWIIKNVLGKNQVEASNLLLEELNNLKKVLMKNDTLLPKLVVAEMIAENLEFASQLIQKKLINPELFYMYKKELSLTKKHKDLTKALKRDYVIYLEMFSNIVSIKKTLKKKERLWLNSQIVKVLYKFVYKPNNTINYLVDDIARILSLTKLPPKEFIKQVNRKSTINKPNKVKNYLGNYYVKPHEINYYVDYIARVHSLHNKMILLKSLIKYGSIKSIDGALSSKDFGFKNIFNDELPYFEDSLYCFNSIESKYVETKHKCLKVLD